MKQYLILSILTFNFISASETSDLNTFLRTQQVNAMNIGAFGTVAKSIAMIGRNSEALRQIGGFTSTITELSNNINMLSMGSTALGAMGISAIVPYAGIVSCVCSLISMIGDDSSDELAEALMQISKQISEFHRDVMNKFDDLENQLDQSHREIMLAFMSLHTQQNRIQDSLREIKRDIDSNQTEIRGKLEQIRKLSIANLEETSKQFAAIHLEKIDKLYSDVTFDFGRNAITPEKLVKVIHEIYNQISIDARSYSLSGENAANFEEKFEHKALDSVFEHPAFSNINLVRAQIEKDSNAVVNPLVWARCVKLLLFVLEEAQKITFATEGDKACALVDIQEVIKIGFECLECIHRMNNSDNISQLVENLKAELVACKQIAESMMSTISERELREKRIQAVETAAQRDISILQSQPQINFERLKNCLNVKGTYGVKYAQMSLGVTRAAHLGFVKFRGRLLQNPSARYDKTPEEKEILQLWGDIPEGHVNNNMSVAFITIPTKLSQTLKSSLLEKSAILSNLPQRVEQEKLLKLQSLNNLNKPISCLIYPEDSKFSLILFCDKITADFAFIKAESIGLGQIKSTYSINNNNFIIKVYFCRSNQESLIKQYTLPFDNIYEKPTDSINAWTDSDHCVTRESYQDLPRNYSELTNEDIFNFWYGGRYAKSGDIVETMECADNPDHHRHGQKVFEAKFIHAPANGHPPTQLTEAHTTFNIVQPTESVKEADKIFKARLVTNVVDTINNQLNAELTLHATKMDHDSKLLTAVAVLAHSQELESPEFNLFRSNFVRDKRSLLNRMQSLQTLDGRLFTHPTIEIDDSLQALEQTRRVLTTKPAEFPLMQNLIRHLRLGHARTQAVEIYRNPQPDTQELMQLLRQSMKQQQLLQEEVAQLKQLLTRR